MQSTGFEQKFTRSTWVAYYETTYDEGVQLCTLKQFVVLWQPMRR